MKKGMLKAYRKNIDNIDDIIIKSVLKRQSIVKKIAVYKKKNKIKVVDVNREKAIYDKLKKASKDYNSAKLLKKVYNEIIKMSKIAQNKLMTKRSK